ncbi:MAG: flagellar biosynthesis protein FlhF [Burkholderiales bacterium]
MKASRFVASCSRDAMQQVRDALGADALILANRATAEGVEILAIAESEVENVIAGTSANVTPERQPVSMEQSAARANVATKVVAAAPRRANAVITPTGRGSDGRKPSEPRSFRDFVRATSGANQAVTNQASAKNDWSAGNCLVAGPQGTQHGATTARGNQSANLTASAQAAPEVMAELKEMKGLLTQQFETLAWNESLRKRPLRGVLLRELLGAGFGATLSRGITERLPDDYSEAESRRWLLEILARNLLCQSDPDIVDEGGVYALVGPTGAGKTTTAAKLAARCVMKFGAQSLGLITTDNYRIGAQDQLRIYGKILGVPVFIAQDAAELELAIGAYAGKHLVLIDTIGMGQRDARLAEQHALLCLPSVRRLLLLNATCQSDTLDDVVRAYGGAMNTSAPRRAVLHGAILTKLDEAIKLGGVLDVVLRHKLRTHFMSNGQRVPEDLHPANAKLLAHRALKAASAAGSRIDSDTFAMAMEIGGNASA